MEDNWYIVLELPFDPPEENMGVIEARIEEKRRYWSEHCRENDPQAKQYGVWLGSIDRIKEDMANSDTRKRMAQQAKQTARSPLDELLKLVGQKGEVTKGEGEKVAARLGMPLEGVRRRTGELGIRWRESGGEESAQPAAYQEIYNTHCVAKPACVDMIESSGVPQDLEAMHAETLYDFLYKDTELEQVEDLPCEALLRRTEEWKAQNKYQPNKSLQSVVGRLCMRCRIHFKNEEEKAKYDQYVAYKRRQALFQEISTIADISGRLTAEQQENYVSRLATLFADRKLAEDVFTAYCKIKGIEYAGGQRAGVFKACRCGYINEVSDGRTRCVRCGMELTIRCPACGRSGDAAAAVCGHCGFKMKNLDKVTSLCELAKLAVEGLDFQAAEAHLADADRLWPRNRLTEPVRLRLSECRQRAGTQPAQLREAVKSKRYEQARRQYAALRGLFPKYRDPALEQEISAAINGAQSLYNQAIRSRQEDEVLDLCAQAAALCADFPMIQELKGNYPPAAPTEFSVEAEPRVRENILRWTIRASKRPVYCVVARSETGRVQCLADGKEIFRGSICTYRDKDIQPGVTYWYNVFAERDGVLSQGAAEGGREVVNLFEIGPVSITPGDRSLRLSWGTLPQGASAELYRIGPGGEQHLASTREESFLLGGMANDVEQRFRVALSYRSGGRKQETGGITVSAAPVCPPVPAEALRVSSAQKGMYEAVWRHTGQGEVRLFASARRPRWRTGEVVPLSALEREMTALQKRPLPLDSARKLREGEQGASFPDPGGETWYLTAAAVKSGSAVVGPLARAGRGASVSIRDIRPVNGRIHIFLDAPQDAAGFAVLYRFDRFPAHRDDPQAVIQRFTRQQYAIHNAILLESPEERTYYFTVFAWFGQGGEREWSIGGERIFDCAPKAVITYAISPARGLFGPGSVTLEFQADRKPFTLPDIDVLSAVGTIPMFRSTASLLYTVPAQTVENVLRVRIPLPKGTPKDTYIKPVFRDESAQAGSQLRLMVRSNHKIT